MILEKVSAKIMEDPSDEVKLESIKTNLADLANLEKDVFSGRHPNSIFWRACEAAASEYFFGSTLAYDKTIPDFLPDDAKVQALTEAVAKKINTKALNPKIPDDEKDKLLEIIWNYCLDLQRKEKSCFEGKHPEELYRAALEDATYMHILEQATPAIHYFFGSRRHIYQKHITRDMNIEKKKRGATFIF